MRENRHLRRLRTSLAGARRRLHHEGGFALVEILVSATLLVVVAGGVLAGIDGPSQISGRNQERTQASTLAQQDQERMRGMPVSSLIGYTQTRSVSVGPATYSVYSKAAWIRDNADTSSCTVDGDDTSGDYLKITSRVSSTGVPPVELNSLLTPPPGTFGTTKGTLAVRITDQLDQPVVGQSVSIAGPDNMSSPTNAAGCAVFGLVEKGTYTISFSRTGWVDPSGQQNVSATTSVTANSTTLVNKSYAQAGTINVSVDTKVGSASPVASPAKAVTVGNAGIPAGKLTFSAPATPSEGSSSFALKVYPFPTGYGVWAGACSAGDPTLYGLPAVAAAPAPGGVAGVTVRQPAITVTGATIPGYGTYPTQPGSHMVFTSIDPGCNEKRSQTIGSGGVAQYPGMPYGNYKLCGDQGGYYAQKNPFANDAIAGKSTTIDYVGSGTCP